MPECRFERISLLLAALSIALGVGTSGCSNPKCWTHDASEVSGGCSVGGSRERTFGGGSSRKYFEKRDRQMKKNIADNTAPCAAGQPIACAILADAERYYSRNFPMVVQESHFTVACNGGVKVTPNSDTVPCLIGASYAEHRGDAGHAIRLYWKACSQGYGRGCVGVIRLDPAHALEPAIKGCELREDEACLHVGTVLSDPANAKYDLARARQYLELGCRRSFDPYEQLCGKLAELDAKHGSAAEQIPAR